MTRHLRAVPTEPAPHPRATLIDRTAERYWRRTAKPQSPRYADLPDEHQAELRAYVQPFVDSVIDIAASELDLMEHPW